MGSCTSFKNFFNFLPMKNSIAFNKRFHIFICVINPAICVIASYAQCKEPTQSNQASYTMYHTTKCSVLAWVCKRIESVLCCRNRPVYRYCNINVSVSGSDGSRREKTQLTFNSTINREFEQIPLNWSLKLPLNCTSLREFRKIPFKSNVMRLFRNFLLDSLGNDVSYRYSWSCTHFILK